MFKNTCRTILHTLLEHFWHSLLRFCAFSLLWFILAGHDPASWLIGIPAVMITVIVSMMLAPPTYVRLSLIGACQFFLFFLSQSIRSGLDVMGRTLASQPRIDPGLIFYTTHLSLDLTRILLANCISLLPGTLSVELKGETITIHTLDQSLPIVENVQALEKRVSRMFPFIQKNEKAT